MTFPQVPQVSKISPFSSATMRTLLVDSALGRFVVLSLNSTSFMKPGRLTSTVSGTFSHSDSSRCLLVGAVAQILICDDVEHGMCGCETDRASAVGSAPDRPDPG